MPRRQVDNDYYAINYTTLHFHFFFCHLLTTFTLLTAKRFFFISCITIALLAVLELISRITLSRIYDRRFDSTLIEEHKYGPTSGLKPNASGTVWGKAFHTDEMGGRNRGSAKSGKPKLLIIGDSVTEGVGVGDSSTFAYLLSDRLDSFDVRNISLIGWSVTDYRNALDTLIAEDSSHDIKRVYIFYCLNDIYGPARAKDLPKVSRGGTMGAINTVLQDRYATYKLIKLLAFRHSDRYYQYDQALYADSNRVSAVYAALCAIDTVCRSRDIEARLYILPYRSQLETGKALPQQVLRRAFSHTNMIYYDLMPEMKNRPNPADLYLFADEIHLSPRGHQVVADIVGRQ